MMRAEDLACATCGSQVLRELIFDPGPTRATMRIRCEQEHKTTLYWQREEDGGWAPRPQEAEQCWRRAADATAATTKARC